MIMARFTFVAAMLLTAFPAFGQAADTAVRIATWNVEHMNKLFDQSRMPYRSQDRQELWEDEEDLLEIRLTLDLKHFDPDILVLQEAADQQSLDEFNRKWLAGRFAYVKAFKTNSPGQWTAIMVKPGFQVLEVREFASAKDPVLDPDLGGAKKYYGWDSLYPRGPGFARVRTPGGKTIWVGTTHIKSKGGNNTPVTRWRIRMTQHLRDTALALAETSDYVAVLGDFNDEFGMDRYETEAAGDAVAQMLAKTKAGQLVSPTQRLKARHENLVTFHSLLKPFGPTFIDHVFVDAALDQRITNTAVIDDPIAHAASDHLPVMITVDLSGN